MPQRSNRRELLADAAIEVLAREGGRGLTHRAIDREAEVPEGTTKNYYPTRSALFLAIAHYLAAQHTAALEGLRSQIPADVTGEDITALYAAMLRRMSTSARSQFLALFELHLEAVRNPEVRAALADITKANVDTAVQLHAAVDRRMSRRGAGLLDAGMLGVALSMLSLPDDLVEELGFDDADGLARALLTLGSVRDGSAIGVLRDFAS
ncbi:TetR/AcrR family transcriptional regulator [Saccharopolyspora phatthalungensis]|uniref:DNA-binding transcriptional regulator YbjK n=1 Tax=Saccharopolyspora phatthalungensis TaxID=664693 RepID=A0A840PZK3_9PSEU|nr:TetR family transcriptional regulator [Saccharopolyspora phatthalungensis]MBB5152661.1 DNA-binding transcriptional regulator YbjK [Saccharopolyspora phatthalungensis]